MKGGFILIICMMAFLKVVYAHEKAIKGPYKTTMTALTLCTKTTLPLQTRNPGLVFRLKFVNTTKTTNLVAGTFTVTRNLKNLTIIAIAYKWEMGKWKTHLTLPRLSCKTPVMTTVVAIMTNIKFDPGSCAVIKGTYKMEFDINVADHIWAPEREYGRMRWRLEFITKKNTITCLLGDNIVEPIKKVNTTK
ncbi:hypothetical protein ABMA28_008950 [Loxostege sticticalis]